MYKTLLFIALLAAATTASAEPWKYSGSLNDGGAPANGRYDLRLTLLDAAKAMSIGSPVTLYAVDVQAGAFTVDVDFGIDLANAPTMQLKTEVSRGNSGFVALGEPTRFDPKATLAGICWDTEGNSGTNSATNFIGTTDNQAFEIRTRNARSFRIEPSALLFNGLPTTQNMVGGSVANTVTANVRGATIAGGGLPIGTADPFFGAFEGPNRVTDGFGTVSGGLNNQAGDGLGDQLQKSLATVGGGAVNVASGQLSTIGGGLRNIASGIQSTIGGGVDNTASGVKSTVVGGDRNLASGLNSTASGILNCAGGDFSWVGGGLGSVRAGNQVGNAPCLGPGGSPLPNSGDADGDNGTFLWADDQNSYFISTGPNQFLVRAAGGMAINTNTPTAGAALTVNGSVAVATSGSLAFGTQTRQMLNLWGPNDFGIGVQGARLYFRSGLGAGFSWYEGGVHSDVTDNGGGGTLRMRLSNTGQLQTTTGTISSLSDARLKDRVEDYSHALDQISALRPVRYHYRDAGKAAFQPEGMHLGFIAQEVQQVFPEWVSQGDDGYLMLSMRGFEAVAVRALQELSAKNDALSEENTDLKATLAAQDARLSAIEAKLK